MGKNCDKQFRDSGEGYYQGGETKSTQTVK